MAVNQSHTVDRRGAAIPRGERCLNGDTSRLLSRREENAQEYTCLLESPPRIQDFPALSGRVPLSRPTPLTFEGVRGQPGSLGRTRVRRAGVLRQA